MNIKALLHRFYEYLYNYNLFAREDVPDDNAELQESPAVLKRQKYSTWLYIFLLIVCIYFLFSTALIKTQVRTVIDSDITHSRFNQLYDDHNQTLSCPCSKATIPFKDFVKNIVTFHPVCSSVFISKEWIEALYLSMANRYSPGQFEKTASSQFRILADLCSLSQTATYNNLIDIDRYEFTTIHLHTEQQIQSKIKATVDIFKNGTSTQIISYLNYLQTLTRIQYYISALNTNALVEIVKHENQYNTRLKSTYTYDGSGFLYLKVYCDKTDKRQSTFLHSINITQNPYIKDRESFEHNSIQNNDILGFYTRCTVLEAIRESTLGCVHEIQCLELLFQYFPELNKTSSNWTNDVLYSKKKLVSVNTLLRSLFIHEWLTEINYLEYFNKCTPSFCTYTITDQMNLSDAIALLITLYGSLTIVLRLIITLLAKLISIFWRQPIHISNNSVLQNTIKQRLIRSIKSLNLFKSKNTRTESDIKQEKISTYVYLILLTGTFLIIFFYYSLNKEMMTITEERPSSVKYNELQGMFSQTLKCPCSTMVLPYTTLISLTPTLHPICSSDFVDQRWLNVLDKTKHSYAPLDGRNILFMQFRLLSILCNLANDTIKEAIDGFMMQSFTTSNVLTETEFNIQLNTILNQFFQSTKYSFNRLIDAERLIVNVDQPYMLLADHMVSSFHPNLVTNVMTNTNAPNVNMSLKLTFRFTETNNTNSTFLDCICVFNSRCEKLVPIYNYDHDSSSSSNDIISYWLPGWKQSCSSMDSLVLSNLQCLYSHSDCFQRLVRSIKTVFMTKSRNRRYWFEPEPLVYNSTVSRFPPNISIGTILEEIMIENWNPSFLHENFYKECSPSHCIYLKQIRTKNIFEVILILISISGGLTMAIRLITPFLVKFVFYLYKRFIKKQREEEQQQQQDVIQPKCIDRLKIIIRKLMKFLYNTIINLNIFDLRDFGGNINPETVEHLGQWSTRLYIILFILSNWIFILYTVAQSEPITKTFDKPSFDQYNNLVQIYGEKLKCSCSIIASKYEIFVQIQPKYHQICSSPFVSDQWRNNMTTNFISDLFSYEKTDYHSFLLAHLKYLQGLCYNSIEIVKNTINQFNSSLLITTELLSKKEFNQRINSIIEQTKSNAPIVFINLLSLIRIVNHGNAFISKYQSNYKYIVPWDHFDEVFVPTEPMIYDNNCTCGLYSYCTTQAGFFHKYSREFFPIKGFKMGCTPSESFRFSTLECFYDQSCLNLIQQYTNSTSSFITPLSLPMNQSLINKTIDELINNLFVETWLTTIEYSAYFNHCLPSLCSYTYIQSFNLFYIFSFLIGLYSGLTIILEWICPNIIQIIMKIYQYRKRRSNIIAPVSTNVVNSNIEMNNSNARQTSTIQTHETNSISRFRYSFKFIIVCFLFICLIIFITLWSIFVMSKSSTTSTTININTTTTVYTTTTITASTSTEILLCQPSFQGIRIETPACSRKVSSVIADFNNDFRKDLIYFCENTSAIHILIANQDGIFQTEKIFQIEHGHNFHTMTACDINNDHQLDLIGLDLIKEEFSILFGDTNATFIHKISTLDTTNYDDFVLVDVNNDNHLDIVNIDCTKSTLLIHFGDSTGKFVLHTTLYTDEVVCEGSIATGDLNHDNCLDIMITFSYAHEIIIYLGYGNGTFKKYMTITTKYDSYLGSLILTHLNGDAHLDVVFRYDTETFATMLGYGNGSFSTIKKFTVDNVKTAALMAIKDFNCDGHLDIIVPYPGPYKIGVLLGSGNENFRMKSIDDPTIVESWWSTPAVLTNDFNNDSFDDILVFDTYYSNIVFMLLNVCQCCLTGIANSNNLTYH